MKKGNKTMYPTNEFEAGGRGNFVIYNEVKVHPLLGDVEQLASQAWLIGRTYSATPQRDLSLINKKISHASEYKKFLSDPSRGITPYGYFDFFHIYAWEVINHDKGMLAKLNGDLKQLAKAPDFVFDFDPFNPNSQSVDGDTIRLALESVALFDKISCDAMGAMINDVPGVFNAPQWTKKGKTYRNPTDNLSFASKFIHFRAPHSVYILDAITGNNLFTLFKKKCGPIAVAMPKGPYKVQIPPEYLEHYLLCYLVAKALSNASPRQVDMALTAFDSTPLNNVKSLKSKASLNLKNVLSILGSSGLHY